MEAALAAHPEAPAGRGRPRRARPAGSAAGRVRRSRRGAAPDRRRLREFLAGTLPEYMLPTGVRHARRAAADPNGKLDRRALPAPDRDGAAAPRTPTEASADRDLGGGARRAGFGVDDDFFAIGGDSIQGFRVLARVARRSASPAPRGLRRADRGALAALVPRVTTTPRRTGSGRRPAARPAVGGPAAAVVPGRADRRGTENNAGVGLRLRGPLDTAALRAALDALVERHEALRTTFDKDDGEAVQIVAPRRRPPAAHRRRPPQERPAGAGRRAAPPVRPAPRAADPGLLVRLAAETTC